jgi:ketosteroid isomerase-like protein
MKSKILLALVAGLLLAADAPKEDAKAVEQAVRSLNEAYLKKDVDTIKRLTGEDLIVVTSSGQRQTRDEQLKSLPDLKLSAYTTEDVRVTTPTKDAAIAMFTASVKGSFKGNDLPAKMAVVTVWAKRDGKWLEVFYQGTPLDKK